MSINNICNRTPSKAATFLSLLFVIACSQVSAETTYEEQLLAGNWYQVEVLIFRYDTPFESTQEKWPQKIDRFFPANLSTLHSGDKIKPLEAFAVLDPDEHSFSTYSAELERKLNTKTLYHAAWRQPRIDKTRAHPLLIQAGELTEDGQFELEGTLKISIKRYIHINTDLWLSNYQKAEVKNDWWSFSKAANPQPFQYGLISPAKSALLEAPIASATPAPITHDNKRPYLTKHIARMQQTRRMNRDELHYLDHPLFGLLVKTTRYEAPEHIPNITNDSTAVNIQQ